MGKSGIFCGSVYFISIFYQRLRQMVEKMFGMVIQSTDFFHIRKGQNGSAHSIT